MKIKLFALIVCVACLVAVLTACSGGSCTTCQDLDKNSKCDVCGIPVVTIVEKVPAEEEVKETVVNPIPTDAKPADVLSFAVEKNIIPAGAKLLETSDGATVTRCGDFFLIRYTEIVTEDAENSANTVYCQVAKLYDPAQDKILVSLSSGDYTTETFDRRTTYSFNVLSASTNGKIAYEIKTVSYVMAEESDYYDVVTQYAYYTLGFDLIVKSENSYTSSGIESGTLYILVDGTYYVMDADSNKVIHTAKADEFINRPAFEAVRGNYGFVENDGVICVFDLTKWLECIYTFDIPAYYNYASVFYLENGNVLVQGLVATPNGSVNYDVLKSGVKYDIVYTMLKPAEKTATNVEFGYYIVDLTTESDDYQTAAAVKNIATVNVINSKQLDKEITLFIDNELNIIGEYQSMLLEFATKFEVIANNRALVTITYGEGSTVRKIIDGSGKIIATLPNSAVVYDGYIKVGNKLYGFGMDLLLDLEEEEYALNYARDKYVIISKDAKVYYWSAAMGSAPKLVATNVSEETYFMYQSISAVKEDYFEIVTNEIVSGDNPSTTVTYTVYNVDGNVIFEADSKVGEFEEMGSVKYFKLTNGNYYFAK